MSDEYIRKEDAINAVSEACFELRGVFGRCEDALKGLPSADVAPVVRCKDCIHNNDCDIQYSAQAGENFFCGFGETEKDVREDIYE